ncbi:MAG: TetR/AcrR family transcriptional regulator [Actinobacteria bacterium]|nr:MAG: TetR/AcrR family transcriptional regulator [Actinomycetota bacterium]
MVRPSNPELAEKILLATAAIIEEHGPDGVTMRGVARRIEYSATTIYLYFENKDDLLDQTVVRAFGWFAEAMTEAAGSGVGAERIRNRARGYVRWALEHKGMYQLMFQHDSIRPLDSETGSVQPRTLPDSEKLIEDAIVSGELPATLDPALMARINWAGLHGVVSLALSGRLFGAPADVGMEHIETQAMKLAEQFVDSWVGSRD